MSCSRASGMRSPRSTWTTAARSPNPSLRWAHPLPDLYSPLLGARSTIPGGSGQAGGDHREWQARMWPSGLLGVKGAETGICIFWTPSCFALVSPGLTLRISTPAFHFLDSETVFGAMVYDFPKVWGPGLANRISIPYTGKKQILPNIFRYGKSSNFHPLHLAVVFTNG